MSSARAGRNRTWRIGRGRFDAACDLDSAQIAVDSRCAVAEPFCHGDRIRASRLRLPSNRVSARLLGHVVGDQDEDQVRRIAPFMAASIAGAAIFGLGAGNASAKGQVAVGVTETIASFNPYADSVSLAYGIWCQVFGCLGIYDFNKGEYVGMLADRWEVDKTDKNVWTFHLKRGLKRHNDGRELTADDVVHSVNAHQHRSAEQAEAEHRTDQGNCRARQIYGENRHQAADGVAARIPVRPGDHHGEGSLREARRARRRSQISLGAGDPTSSRSW